MIGAHELKISPSLCTVVAYSRGTTTAVRKSRGRRIARATGAMARFKKVWNSIRISVRTKLRVFMSCVMSVLLFACETWTLRKRDSLMAFEMKCSEEFSAYTGNMNNACSDQTKDSETNNMMQMIMEKKLELFGYIFRMDDNWLVKNVVFGIIDGLNRRKTEQVVDGRHQRMVSGRRTLSQSQYHGTAGPIVMEMSCH